VLLTAHAAAAETKSANAPEEMIRDGALRIMEGVRAFIERLPQFLPPEILPNGDIVIRRRPREPHRSWPYALPEPGPDDLLKT
jgi:hypothetical protein